MRYDVKRINKARRRRGAEPLPEPRPGLGRPVGPRPARADLVRLYVKKGLSLRATAEALGVSKEAVGRGLVEYGIKPHRRVRPSRLAVYGRADLRRRVKVDGLRATARALGVSGPTLLEFMRRRASKKTGC
jgi:transposase-like protein